MSRDTVKGIPPELPEDSPAPQPVDPSTGQHKDHWILSEAERAKGFVRPVRESYQHKKCGTITSMPRAIAETYAVNPGYYGQTFCCGCKGYFAVAQFTWKDSDERVGD